MKKRAVVARLALVALIFVAIFMMGRTFAASSVAARPVKLVITGPTGQGFIGIYVADGVTNSVSAVAPATVEFQAKDVTYEFLRDGGQGEARVELFVENLSRTSATSGERHGVMGWLRYSTGKESYGAGDF